MKYFAALVFMVMLFSCKEKDRHHDEALQFYVSVQLQTKESDNIIKAFSSELSKTCNETSVKKTHVMDSTTFSSVKNSLLKTIAGVDKRLMILQTLNLSFSDFFLKLCAAHYLKDCRNFLTRDITQIVNSYRTSPKQINMPAPDDVQQFKLRKEKFKSNVHQYQMWSKIFCKEYSLTDDELAKYGLEK